MLQGGSLNLCWSSQSHQDTSQGARVFWPSKQLQDAGNDVLAGWLGATVPVVCSCVLLECKYVIRNQAVIFLYKAGLHWFSCLILKEE
jgi:hypothetical protein